MLIWVDVFKVICELLSTQSTNEMHRSWPRFCDTNRVFVLLATLYAERLYVIFILLKKLIQVSHCKLSFTLKLKHRRSQRSLTVWCRWQIIFGNDNFFSKRWFKLSNLQRSIHWKDMCFMMITHIRELLVCRQFFFFICGWLKSANTVYGSLNNLRELFYHKCRHALY